MYIVSHLYSELGVAIKHVFVDCGRHEILRSSCIKEESGNEIFADFRLLKADYGDETLTQTGAIGLYSYLNRVSVGLKQFMALNRKFALRYIRREDIVPLTQIAAQTTGLSMYEELLSTP
jgi:hypothetical protein